MKHLGALWAQQELWAQKVPQRDLSSEGFKSHPCSDPSHISVSRPVPLLHNPIRIPSRPHNNHVSSTNLTCPEPNSRIVLCVQNQSQGPSPQMAALASLRGRHLHPSSCARQHLPHAVRDFWSKSKGCWLPLTDPDSGRFFAISTAALHWATSSLPGISEDDHFACLPQSLPYHSLFSTQKPRDHFKT